MINNIWTNLNCFGPLSGFVSMSATLSSKLTTKAAQLILFYTRLHSRLATHTTQSIIRHSFLSNQQWLGSWIKYHFSNKSQVGKLIPSCQATHDLDSTSADTSYSACFTSASKNSQSDGFQFNLSCTNGYVIQELKTKTIVSITDNGWSNLLTNPRYLT